MNKTMRAILALTFAFGIAGVSHAALWDRGGGLIYDDAQLTTWLQNANLALTETFGVEGIDPANGIMLRSTADAYIAAMNAANYLGYSDWRLPDTQYPSSAGIIPGEMYYLYIGLGNSSGPNGGNGQGTNPVIMYFTDGNGNEVQFENFINSRYFYSEPYANCAQNFFHFYFGAQWAYWGGGGSGDCNAVGFVWAVRDGDSTPMTNNPPSLDPIGRRSGSEGQLLEFAINADDPDPGDTLTFSADNLPNGASFDPATATFSWMPSFEDAGNYENVQFCVTDDGTPPEVDCESITITIGDVNRSPVIDSVTPISVQEYDVVEFTITASDPDGHDVFLSSGDLPMGSVFEPSNGLFMWIPDYTQAGVHSIDFFATDNGVPAETGEAIVVITVSDIPPTALVNEIIDSYTNDLDLSVQVVNSYTANLKKVERFIERGKVRPALNQLDAFIYKVAKDIDKGRISDEEGQSLIGMAIDIMNKIGG